MYEGDTKLEHWNEAERQKIRKEVSGLVLSLTADAKSLNAREVLFEAYLALIWLSADISAFTYKDFLEYVADLNGRYLAQLEDQIEDVKKQIAEEGQGSD